MVTPPIHSSGQLIYGKMTTTIVSKLESAPMAESKCIPSRFIFFINYTFPFIVGQITGDM